MASQNEGNPKHRVDEVEKTDPESGSTDTPSPGVETEELEFKPFSDADPFRAARVGALVDETADLLGEVQVEPVGFGRATDDELASFYEDAVERAKWSKARQDGLLGVLRLGRPVPRRSQRVL